MAILILIEVGVSGRSAALKLDSGRATAGREGVLVGLRDLDTKLPTGLAAAALEEPTDGVRNPNLGGAGDADDDDAEKADVVVVRPSGGREGCLGRVLAAPVAVAIVGVLPGPTDLLKLTVALRAGGVREPLPPLPPGARLVMYRLAVLTGTKMPEPGMVVRKYRFPSTSPLFLPRSMCSGASSMPAKRPGFPATDPRYRTVPYMPPGTLTTSPT